MTSENREHLHGLFWEFLTALDDAEARSTESPYGLHDVADVAVDPSRIAVSDEVRRSKGFLRATRKELRARTEALKDVNSSFDEAADS